MILYGPINNSFEQLYGGTPFTIYGATNRKLGPEELTSFPIYGPIKIIRLAPTKFTLTMATLSTKTTGPNLSGLVISDIASIIRLETPGLVNSIYPYLSGNVKMVLGTDKPYRIVDYNLLFETVPTGPVTIIPFNRLQLYTGEIKRLTAVNTIPNRLEFTAIKVSGDFEFSLNATGPWSASLSIVDAFYIKAPNISQTGSHFDRALTVTATAIPVG